jgi:hypothetical protein
MDFVVALPVTSSGFDSIFVCVDRLTKMVRLSPCNATDSADDIARLFINSVFRSHGLPRNIVSDRDPKFVSKFWQSLLHQLNVSQSLSTSYHPQTDGNTERVNRVMEDILRHFVLNDQSNWDTLLPLVEFAINNATHESLKTSPFMLNYGRSPNLPVIVLGNLRKNNAPSAALDATSMVDHMHSILASAKSFLYAAQQRQKAYADQKRLHIVFAEGESVLLSTKHINLRMPGSPKLLPKFIGPFPIIHRISDVAYRIKLPDSLPIHNVFHVSLLKAYFTDGALQPPPPPVLLNDTLAYEVEKILLHRSVKRGSKSVKEYLVKWVGYGPENNTWEPEQNCMYAPDRLQDYWDSVNADAQRSIKPQRIRKRKR